MTLWENASLNCVIPKQPLSCVWWRELGFITASTGDRTSPERGGMRERDGARRREEARHHTDRMNDTSYDCLGRSCSLWLLYCTLPLSSISQALVHWFITFNKTAIDDVVFSPREFPNFLPRWVFPEGLILLLIFFIFFFHCFIFIHRCTTTELIFPDCQAVFFKLQYEIFLPGTTHWKSR